jgi:hypothetical protein
MKFHIFTLTVIALAGLSIAQLLPSKNTESVPKLDSALVFRVNYGDETAPINAPQKEEEPSTEQLHRNNHGGFDFKSSLIWTGIFATEAILSKGASANSLCFRGQP